MRSALVMIVSLIVLTLSVASFAEGLSLQEQQDLKQTVDRLQHEVELLKAQVSSRQPASLPGTGGLKTEDLQNQNAAAPGGGAGAGGDYPALDSQLRDQLQQLQEKQKETQKFMIELEGMM